MAYIQPIPTYFHLLPTHLIEAPPVLVGLLVASGSTIAFCPWIGAIRGHAYVVGMPLVVAMARWPSLISCVCESPRLLFLPPNRHRGQPIINLVVILIRQLVNPFQSQLLSNRKPQPGQSKNSYKAYPSTG